MIVIYSHFSYGKTCFSSHYAGTSRYDARNYDLVINMAGKTEDEVADLILRYI